MLTYFFGLSCAPWVFNKITKVVGAFLWSENHHVHRRHADNGRIQINIERLGQGSCVPPKICDLPKSVMEPKITKDFLGFLVDFLSIERKLLEDKIKNIIGEARRILTANQVTALTLSRILGKMNTTTKAISMAPLFYQQLQAEVQQALGRSCQNYNAPMAREELDWWNTHLTNWNGQQQRNPASPYRQMPLEQDEVLSVGQVAPGPGKSRSC